MDIYHSSIFTGLASFIAAVSAFIGVIWGLIAARANLKWKKLSEATKVRRDLVGNKKVLDAMNMLDNECNREFKTYEGLSFKISNNYIDIILDTLEKSGPLNEVEIYINDCFENLFDFFSDIYKYIDKKILEEEDGLVGDHLGIINKHDSFIKYLKEILFSGCH